MESDDSQKRVGSIWNLMLQYDARLENIDSSSLVGVEYLY